MGTVLCLCQAIMLLTILLLNLVLCSLATDAGVDGKSTPNTGLEGLEKLEEKLELRLRDMETRMEVEKEKLEMRMKYEEERHSKEKKELEAKNKEMETRLGELEKKMEKEKNTVEKKERGLEAAVSKLRLEMEEVASNCSKNAQTNPSLRDLPIVLISAWRYDTIAYPQTVTFESFLANFNNQDRPGGGSGVLDLDSGVFTCFTTGYYTVSFSADGVVGPSYGEIQRLYLYKNGSQLPETYWKVTQPRLDEGFVDVTNSRIVILHLDAGDTLELRMTE